MALIHKRKIYLCIFKDETLLVALTTMILKQVIYKI